MIGFTLSAAAVGFLHRVCIVGETCEIELRGNVSVQENDDVQWVCNATQRISRKQNIITKPEKYNLLKNGTLQIYNGTKEDSGNYSVQIYDNKTGNRITNQMTQLQILHGVSDLRVVSTCSGGTHTVTCSAGKGDDVQFMWMLVNQSLVLSESNKHTIHLGNYTHEDLVCVAVNAVSRIQKGVPACRGYLPTFAAVAFFLTAALWSGVLGRVRKKEANEAEENIYLDMRGITPARRPVGPAVLCSENSIYETFKPLFTTMPTLSPERGGENVFTPTSASSQEQGGEDVFTPTSASSQERGGENVFTPTSASSQERGGENVFTPTSASSQERGGEDVFTPTSASSQERGGEDINAFNCIQFNSQRVLKCQKLQ
ncbi:uncharacterized protein LOC143487797 isoform X2 [Brachyhypopomus gauderio]|uniref:uncharacterized protein LOC143487797 isoform X2 n=1 Tax=Brachyhypopomus gauderio TaxID=698409 RepID=UPI004042303F